MLTTAAATISNLQSSLVRVYLAAELAGTLALEAARYWPLDFDGHAYQVLYCVALLPIRILACVIAWRQSRWMSLAALPFAAGLLYLATQGFHPSLSQWIAILDGVIVTSAGLALAFTAAFSPNARIYGTLTILWMLLGLFDFGYALQPYGKWSELNDSLLPVIVIGAFGWIAFSARSAQSVQRAASHR